LPFAATDEIKLGYSTTIAGSFTIKIDQRCIFWVKMFLSKINNNTIVNLKTKISLYYCSWSFNERFVLRFTDKTLALNDLVKTMNQL
jgi:hypothetical protein